MLLVLSFASTSSFTMLMVTTNKFFPFIRSSAKEGSSLPYQPAPGSPDVPAKKDESDSEEDTLDAFMKNLVKF